jgi:hypothetical protein
MNQNLIGSIYGRSSIKSAHFVPIKNRSGNRPVILPSRFANFNCFNVKTSVYFYYKISVFQNVIETVSNIKTVLRIRTLENNVGIVSFNLFGVWWRLSEMQLIVSPVGPRGSILEGPANDVFVSDLLTGKHFYCLGLSKIKFLSVLVTS